MRTKKPTLRLLQSILHAAICSALLLPQGTFAGAWTQPAGATYNKFAVNYYISDQQLDGDGDLVDADAEFTIADLTYYGEFGIGSNTTLLTAVTFQSLEVDPDAGDSIDNAGVGDIDAGARYKLLERDWGLLSLQGLIKIPEAYDEEDELPLGDGQYDIEVRVLYGRSLPSAYLNLEGGYRWRDEDPSDEWKYLAEIGYAANETLSLRAKLDGTASAKNADTQQRSGNPSLSPDYDVGKLELTAGFAMSRQLTFEFTVTPTAFGRDTAAGTTFSAALIIVTQPAN